MWALLPCLIIALLTLTKSVNANNTTSIEEIISLAAQKSEESSHKLVSIFDQCESPDETVRLANAITEEGESVLHLACIWGSVEKVTALLAAGADPNFRATKLETSLSMTPLTWCAYAGYTDCVKAFLADARTDPNLVVRTEKGGYVTALDIAESIKDRGAAAVLQLRKAGAKTWREMGEPTIVHDDL
eukprot:CFRG5849T1